HHMRLASFGRDHDHGNSLGILHSGELLDEFQTIHHRHVDVTKDQINLACLKNGKRFGSVSSLGYIAQLDTRLTQRALYDLSHDRGIVDDESTYGHEDNLILSAAVSGKISACAFCLHFEVYRHRRAAL